MKIKITEIEATSEDLRQSRTLADAFVNILRTGLTPACSGSLEAEEEEKTMEEEHEQSND